MKLITWLDLELAYYEDAVQHVSCYAMRTPCVCFCACKYLSKCVCVCGVVIYIFWRMRTYQFSFVFVIMHAVCFRYMSCPWYWLNPQWIHFTCYWLVRFYGMSASFLIIRRRYFCFILSLLSMFVICWGICTFSFFFSFLADPSF